VDQKLLGFCRVGHYLSYSRLFCLFRARIEAKISKLHQERNNEEHPRIGKLEVEVRLCVDKKDRNRIFGRLSIFEIAAW
jgi:hypothetical protein